VEDNEFDRFVQRPLLVHRRLSHVLGYRVVLGDGARLVAWCCWGSPSGGPQYDAPSLGGKLGSDNFFVDDARFQR
jgi:hypothetical protein